MSQISQENAYIFRITYVDNVPWILRNGSIAETRRFATQSSGPLAIRT